MENQNQNQDQSQPTSKAQLLKQVQKYNQVNSEVQKFADTLNYDKIQDQLKEDMAFTST